MRPLKNYKDEMERMIAEAARRRGIGGAFVAWVMMWMCVFFTAPLTYALVYNGMQNNSWLGEYVYMAALAPVVLLEGSMLSLTLGRHRWFRSTAQRHLANIASWAIFIILALTSIVHFAQNYFSSATAGALELYSGILLPAGVVGAGALWKKLYDLDPQSEIRTKVLEADARFWREMIDIYEQQNALMLAAYREGLNADEVTDARDQLFERAAIEHARTIAGFIGDGSEKN
jgi:hypothetical protein